MNRAARSLTLAALLAGAAFSFAQQTSSGVTEVSARKSTFDVSVLNGVPLHGETRGANGLEYQAVVAVTVDRGVSTLHRLVIDRTHHLYFGYTLFADRVAASPDIHLHFGQLRSFSMFQGVDLTGFDPGRSPAPLTEKTVEVGVPITIPLEIDPQGSELLTDTLNFGPPA